MNLYKKHRDELSKKTDMLYNLRFQIVSLVEAYKLK